jgi:hypothetical protein
LHREVRAHRCDTPIIWVNAFQAPYASLAVCPLRGSAPRAATLAAVTIGTGVGIFDERLLSATLVVLVTVIVSGIGTRAAARKVDGDSLMQAPGTDAA